MLHVVLGLFFGVLMQAGGPLSRVPENVAAASLIRQGAPVYPPQAARAAIEGDVVLEAEVDQQGVVAALRTLAGHPQLTQAAMDAVRQYRYDPAMLKGEARIATTVRVKFARERAKVVCGPYGSVRLYKEAPPSDPIGTLDCGVEVIVLTRTMSAVEVEGPTDARGWVNALDVLKGPSGSEPSAGSAPAGIAEAILECAQRATLNIFDNPGAAVISRLSCGEAVSVLAQDDPYAKIRTAAGVEGWVVADSLTIRPK